MEENEYEARIIAAARLIRQAAKDRTGDMDVYSIRRVVRDVFGAMGIAGQIATCYLNEPGVHANTRSKQPSAENMRQARAERRAKYGAGRS